MGPAMSQVPSPQALYTGWLRRSGEFAHIAPWRLALMVASAPTYPGGSKSRVRRAGEHVRQGNATSDDLAVIDLWRAAHRPVLNTFQAILRNRTRGNNVIVAQRHKRKRTIFDKLRRLPKMELHRMDDVAGCRLIFDSIEELRAFRAQFHKAKFNHRRRNKDDKYDYIAHPNPNTGYRGIHDVYEYDVNSEFADQYRGLLIEIQYRSRYQHAWATCVEVVGFITENQPKFQEGDKRFQDILSLASEIIARVYEHLNANHPELSDAELVQKFLKLDDEIGFINLLHGLNTADHEISAKRNVILIFSDDLSLETRSFRDATDALRALFSIEKEQPGKDVVLVRADTTGDIRIAFKNYFSDARDFITLIENGCEKLAGKKVIRPRNPQNGRRRNHIAAMRRP
jgi:ppGpp synthetase/RelA/SpoT-type nucleotidyltranferase